MKAATRGKRLRLVALTLCVIFIFVITLNGLMDSLGHPYFYISRTGWRWGAFVEMVTDPDGKTHETGKGFYVGPFAFTYSYNLIIDTNSVSSNTNSTRQP